MTDNRFGSENERIPAKDVPKYHLHKIRGYSVSVLFGLIAKIHGIGVAQYCVHQWVLPKFNNTDEHRVYTMQFLEEYLAKKNLVKELKYTMQHLKLHGWEMRDLPTIQDEAKLSKQKHKVMMRYAAIFRIGIFLGDYKLEEGNCI